MVTNHRRWSEFSHGVLIRRAETVVEAEHSADRRAGTRRTAIGWILSA